MQHCDSIHEETGLIALNLQISPTQEVFELRMSGTVFSLGFPRHILRLNKQERVYRFQLGFTGLN